MSVRTQHLIVFLLLQFNGLDGARPALALIPRPAAQRRPERLVLPLAIQYRRQVQAQLELLSNSPSDPLLDTVGPVSPQSPSTGSPQPVRGSTELLYTLMSLQH